MMTNRSVKVRFTIETVMSVPVDWDEEMINFRFGPDSRWCADNLLDDLCNRSGEDDCNCDIITGEYVGEANKDEETKYWRNHKT
jgi:hypothetical protein